MWRELTKSEEAYVIKDRAPLLKTLKGLQLVLCLVFGLLAVTNLFSFVTEKKAADLVSTVVFGALISFVCITAKSLKNLIFSDVLQKELEVCEAKIIDFTFDTISAHAPMENGRHESLKNYVLVSPLEDSQTSYRVGTNHEFMEKHKPGDVVLLYCVKNERKEENMMVGEKN